MLLERKGNSLFAEVDDQRQKMKSVLQGERSHYTEMKKSFNSKEIEIRRLKRENFNIKQEISNCSNLITRGEEIALKSLTDLVNHLRNENKKLEALSASTERKLMDAAKSQNFGWIDSLITASNNECRELKDKLLTVQVDNTSLAGILKKAQKDLAIARLEAVKMKIFLGKLIETHNIKLQEIDMIDSGIADEDFCNFTTEKLEKFDVSEIEESQDKADITKSLNESTIFLLGGRERLGNFVALKPQDIPVVSDVDKENCKDSPSKDFVKSPVKPPRAINVLKSPVKFTQPKEPKKASSPTPDVSPKSQLPEQINAELNAAGPKPGESQRLDSSVKQEEPEKKAKQRSAIIVKRFLIPSKTRSLKSEIL